MLAREVVFLGGGQGGVAVSGTDHTDLVGVGAEFLLQLQAPFQGFACILARQHGIGFGLGDIKVADIPGFKVGEFVIGYQLF